MYFAKFVNAFVKPRNLKFSRNKSYTQFWGIYNCEENQSYTKDLVIKDLQEKLGINLRQSVEIESSG